MFHCPAVSAAHGPSGISKGRIYIASGGTLRRRGSFRFLHPFRLLRPGPGTARIPHPASFPSAVSAPGSGFRFCTGSAGRPGFFVPAP